MTGCYRIQGVGFAWERLFTSAADAAFRQESLSRDDLRPSHDSKNMSEIELFRATILHTPRNPFLEANALETFADGGLLIANGRIQAVGEYGALAASHPEATTRDWRDSFLLPGFVDAHVHFPQVRVLGTLGSSLLEWLERFALPEEARMADTDYAKQIAAEFLHGLASNGTTTALVFGAHFETAMRALFSASAASRLRIASGLVMSDRMLIPELYQTPEEAYRISKRLIAEFHGMGRLRYAVTPRFALSASEPVLEVCQTLLREHPDAAFQTHINENRQEVAEVRKMFPWAADYLAVYERFGLSNERAVLAHNVQATGSELARMAAAGASVTHCPCSNASLGSGFFPMRRHVIAGVRFALGTDVGAGTGFGMFKEGLQAYLLQRLCPDGYPLTSAHLLYLATSAGAAALGLAKEIGDFGVGKSADFVRVRPSAGTPLAAVVAQDEDPARALPALFTMAGAESIREVRVAGGVVFGR